MNIFVARLDYGVTSQDLEDLFSDYGSVSSAKVIMDRDTGKSKGFGFVEMEDDDAGRSAINELNDYEVKGRNIVVKQAEDRREKRPSRSDW
jgi:RNA recognition motif-containing protein